MNFNILSLPVPYKYNSTMYFYQMVVIALYEYYLGLLVLYTERCNAKYKYCHMCNQKSQILLWICLNYTFIF